MSDRWMQGRLPLESRPLDEIAYAPQSLAESRALEKPKPVPVLDLMDALKASLAVPSGPTKPHPLPSSNTRDAYEKWRGSDEGLAAMDDLSQRALDLLEDGAQRVSVNALVEELRLKKHVQINNTYRAYIADDLVVWYPVLAAVIERRRRRAG